MCGITAVLCAKDTPAVALLYDALLALQHRGQDAAGIVTEDDGRLCLRKDNGMVRDVFHQDNISKLTGDIGIGHVRYPTAGSSSCSEAQPFYVNTPFGLTLAHNGNLINTEALKNELMAEWRHVNTGSDSEVLLNILAGALLECLMSRLGNMSPRPLTQGEQHGRTNGSVTKTAIAPIGGTLQPLADPSRITGAEDADVLYAAKLCMRRCIGGFAVVAMITGWGILAFRDPHGIRPLTYGRRKIKTAAAISGAPSSPSGASSAPTRSTIAGTEYEYMVASESGALNALGFELVADVPAGHALLLRRGAEPQMHDCVSRDLSPRPTLAPCLFEYVYFARPDSVLDGISVYRTRLKMGEKLANRIVKLWPSHDIDVVIPVPDTARTSALECSVQLGIKYREGFIKNRYVGRTFIMPQQGLRKKSVRQKLNPIVSEFKGRNVLLVDDSIVRGTTSKEIIEMAREAGARRVYMASAAPPVRFPNIYGIDMPTKEELVAGHTADGADTLQYEKNVALAIGADRVFYQELEDLRLSVTEEAAEVGCDVGALDSSCFDGVYVTGTGEEYFSKLAAKRTSGRGGDSSATHMLDTLEVAKRQRKA